MQGLMKNSDLTLDDFLNLITLNFVATKETPPKNISEKERKSEDEEHESKKKEKEKESKKKDKEKESKKEEKGKEATKGRGRKRAMSNQNYSVATKEHIQEFLADTFHVFNNKSSPVPKTDRPDLIIFGNHQAYMNYKPTLSQLLKPSTLLLCICSDIVDLVPVWSDLTNTFVSPVQLTMHGKMMMTTPDPNARVDPVW